MPAQEKSQQTSSKCLAANRFQVKVVFTCEDKEKPVVHPAGSGVVWGMPADLHSAGLWSHVLLIDIKTVSHNLIRKIHVSSEMTTLVTLRVICLHPSCTKKQIRVLCLGWCPSKAMSCFLHTTSSQQTFLEYKHVILEELNYLCNLDWLQTLFHAIDCDNGTNKTQT